MIRRETQDAWLIIDQREHARVSAELFAALPTASEYDRSIAQAIYRHDDGWQEWDEGVSFDEKAGRPLDFREMSRSDQDAIWMRSVEAAVDLGALAQAIIASHFIALRGAPAETSQQNPRCDTEFVRRYQPKVDAWLPELNPLQFADGLAALKWFDILSLWLCCSAQKEVWNTVDFRGAPIELSPESRTAGEPADPYVLQVHPWPFAEAEVTVQTPARRLPIAVYESRESLLAALHEGERLVWCLKRRLGFVRF